MLVSMLGVKVSEMRGCFDVSLAGGGSHTSRTCCCAVDGVINPVKTAPWSYNFIKLYPGGFVDIVKV